MRVLDLFSGIGGFSLGLERAGMTTIAFCEIDPFCQAILKRHWPHVPIHDDIRTLDGRQFRADLVCGGFPCQPYSSASRGRRLGAKDDRALWPEMRRVIGESKPAWVLCENVAHFEQLDLERVVSDMEADSFEVQSFEIPACAVGHDHKRTRIWLLGYSDRNSQSVRAIDAEAPGVSGHRPDTGSSRASHGISRRMDRARQERIGNSVTPQIPEAFGRAILRRPSNRETGR